MNHANKKTADYDSSGCTLTIGISETVANTTINVTMDGFPGEGNETFINRIDGVSHSGVRLGERESTVTILDVDGEL